MSTITAIGFTNKYYTLWEISEETRPLGNGRSYIVTHYNYIKNISFDKETAISKYPNAVIDENLRGKTQSWETKKEVWDNVDTFRFGKYKGEKITGSDISYLEWYWDQVYSDHKDYVSKILKENGYNALRSAHNPCSKTALEICDRLGMYVMDEYIDHWYIHKTMYDYVDFFFDWWKQDLTDMVDKDYNHPSVILYSTGNEVAETAQQKGIQLAKDMTAYLHALDATRPVTCGVNIFFNFLNHIGFGQYSDEKAKKEAERARKPRPADPRLRNVLL